MLLSLLVILRRRDSTPRPAWLAYTPSYTTAQKYPRRVSEKTSHRKPDHVLHVIPSTFLSPGSISQCDRGYETSIYELPRNRALIIVSSLPLVGTKATKPTLGKEA
jgi:hypothetical protein